MAKFNAEMPIDEINRLAKLTSNVEKMMTSMTREAAQLVEQNVRANITASFDDPEPIAARIKVTKDYKTPSDDGVNTKVGIYGYFINKAGKLVPAPLAAAGREYGTSKNETKKPFFRRSFKKAQIEGKMHEVERRYLPPDD